MNTKEGEETLNRIMKEIEEKEDGGLPGMSTRELWKLLGRWQNSEEIYHVEAADLLLELAEMGIENVEVLRNREQCIKAAKWPTSAPDGVGLE